MTGILLTTALILLLVAALEVTHRRSTRRWHPGRDDRRDRDSARLAEELRAASQAEPRPTTPAQPVHLAPPTSARTDARLITRVAA